MWHLKYNGCNNGKRQEHPLMKRHTVTFSRKPKVWSFHVVALQTTVKKCIKMLKLKMLDIYLEKDV